MTENDEALREQLAAALTDNNRLTWALKEANDRLAAMEAEFAGHKKAFSDLLNERSHLRLLVQGVEAERDALREQLEVREFYRSMDYQRAEKAERILAMLRTPVDAVVEAGVGDFDVREKYDDPANVVAQIIYAAVAAAEKEVQP